MQPYLQVASKVPETNDSWSSISPVQKTLFYSHHRIDHDRLVQTLWGCIRRRLISVRPEIGEPMDEQLFRELKLPLNLTLRYNEQHLTSTSCYTIHKAHGG